MLLSPNLSLRIAAILLAGFVALQILLLASLAWSGFGDTQRPYNLPEAYQVAAMADALEHGRPQSRAGLLAAFNDSLYQVRIAPVAAQASSDEDLLRLRAAYAEALAGREVTLSGEQPWLRRLFGSRPRPARFVAPVALSVRLADGHWMVVESRPSALINRNLRRRAIWGAVGAALLLAALLLAVRQTTRPLVRLSRGVRRFAADLDEPDIPVTGPREVREVAQALNEMKARIAALVEQRTRVLAAIAHDMRTYLTRLRLRAEYIGDRAQRDRAARDLDEMSMLLDDTLLLATQGGEAAPDAVQLNVADELIALAIEHRELGNGVELRCSLDRMVIRARRTGFRRVLSNLIDNGRRHGRQVSIAAHPVGETIRIEVRDDGSGVPEEALATLGEPFHRLDPSRDRETGGAGLGLAIVRALVARDRASVRFENAESGGLSVMLSYPADRAADDTTS
ncbi:ATP-binding protein [Sphingomonas sp. OTU376]|uniref:ATP-binding protein n=1 Tax=Sphingomonas sp. OTU376 TaxID=3043863 RepID=UPI00313D1CDC